MTGPITDPDNFNINTKPSLNVLITGGSGTLGKALVSLLANIKKVNKIIVFSRSENLQYEMKKEYPEGGEAGLRYFVGDVRDIHRTKEAFAGVDIVIHAAAMKHVDTCEYNIQECIATNIAGTQNVIQACVYNHVRKAIIISTDKAPNPTTLYGATKLVGERLFINANNYGSTIFSCVRYGNVVGSRGSVLTKWKALAEKGKPIPITDKNMTRFFWSIKDAANFILKIPLVHMRGGEIFIPFMKSYSLLSMAQKYSSGIKEIGIRGYEKIHEIMITPEERRFTYKTPGCYIVYPHQHDWVESIKHDGIKVDNKFIYTSKEVV